MAHAYNGNPPTELSGPRLRVGSVGGRRGADRRRRLGRLGLDHYEGRSWLGWHHHTALVAAAHGFLTLERAPFSPAAGLTLPATVRLLQPLFKCWTGRCHTRSQPVDLDRLPLRSARQDE
jgi:hypothetical protein